jgi:AAA domain
MKQANSSEDRARYAQMTREERLDTFKHLIAHPHLITADQAVREAIRETGGALLIFVCGAPGVGKTTMKNRVIRKERVPILSLSARPPLSGSFDWKVFLQSGILALEQSWIGRKIALDTGDEEERIHSAQPHESGARRRPLNRSKDDDLRVSLETAIKRRRPAAVIIDDAQHLGKVSSGRQLQNQLDCIKSLADITETVHVLIGRYELLALHIVTAQIVGHSIIIHFPRYRSTDEELSQFKGVLSTFQDLLPFEEETGILLDHWEYCYERSLGCVGILHDMLLRAVHSALWSGEKMLSEEYLKRYALSEADCYLMMREISEGERECPFGPGRPEL